MSILPPTPVAIAKAAAVLRAGGLVAFPTETVYGLGADATQSLAVAAIFSSKGRPQFNPLIVHTTDIGSAKVLGRFGPLAELLAAEFWPGPLTLVVPRAEACPVALLATAGLSTIALRVPSNPVAAKLLHEAGVPIAAPSANRSGHVSATRAEHVQADFGARLPIILDGGVSQVGLESTVVDACGDRPVLLRAGAVPSRLIEKICGFELVRAMAGSPYPQSPGQMLSHYAPRARLRLEAECARSGEGLLAFGQTPKNGGGGPVLNLSARSNLIEAAANLFDHLRALDLTGVNCIAVMPIPFDGLGEAINDRLSRAAWR